MFIKKWVLSKGSLEIGARTLIAGVINVTPNSFFDGGKFLDFQKAIEQGLLLIEEGADLLDIGGESSKPGAKSVSEEEELFRILPVIEGILKYKPKAVVSVDTYKFRVAKEAIAAGTQIINDITALKGNVRMASLIASTGVGVILMHMQGTPKNMQANPTYKNVSLDVEDFLSSQIIFAEKIGIKSEQIVIDPGIGFGKKIYHNLLLIDKLSRLKKIGYPVMLGASRKSMLGEITGKDVEERLWSSVGVNVVAVMKGADIVRVHDVKEVRDAILVADAIRYGEFV